MLIMADFISIAHKGQGRRGEEWAEGRKRKRGRQKNAQCHKRQCKWIKIKWQKKWKLKCNAARCHAPASRLPLCACLPRCLAHSAFALSPPPLRLPLLSVSLSAGCCRPWLSVCCQLTLHVATLSVCHLPLASCQLHVCLALPCLVCLPIYPKLTLHLLCWLFASWAILCQTWRMRNFTYTPCLTAF